MKYASIAVTAIGCLLFACSKTPSESETPPPKLTVSDFSTPDRALKSYWAQKDWASLWVEAQLKSIRESNAKYRESTAQVTTGDTKAFLSSPATAYKKEVLRREIDAIKQETDSRAVAVARITLPATANAELTADELREREKGTLFKYIIEKDKDSGLWKVVEVWTED